MSRSSLPASPFTVLFALRFDPPGFIFRDCPITSLENAGRSDEPWSDDVEELVGELADRGTTVFMTTHDLAGVEAIVERIGVLVDGKLVLDEDLEALKWLVLGGSTGNQVRAAREVLERDLTPSKNKK